MLKSGNQRLIAGCSALKTYALSDAGLHCNFGQIIFAHGMQNAGQHFINGISFRQIIVDIAFHKNSTTVAGNRRRGIDGAPGIVGKAHAEFQGLLLYKATGARGADIVHDG